MSGPFSSQYGGYQYQSPENRALSGITPESYDYRDQSKLLTKLINDTSYMAAYMKKMQKGIDQANENFIQQLQDLLNELNVVFAGGGDTGFDFGDLKYVLQGIGALFGWTDTGNGLILPLNYQDAAWNFMSQYVLGTQNWQQLQDTTFDQSIATMLDIFDEVPVVGQAAQQLAVILSQMHDQSNSLTKIFNQFFSAFNITPQNPIPSLGDYFTNINTLYTGLETLFGGTDYGSASPIYDQIGRWDQQVMDAIIKLTEGDLSGIIGLISLSQLTNVEPDKQVESDFGDVDAVAANNDGWIRDSTVGHTALGSAKITANGFDHAMTGTPVSVTPGQTLAPETWVKWTGLTANSDAIKLQIRWNNGQTDDVAKITNPAIVADWTHLTGTITVPTGVTSGRLRLYVAYTCTAGTIWFDDSPNRFNTTFLPQVWIQDLTLQWEQAAKLWGFDPSQWKNVNPTTWWTNAFNTIFPPIPQANIDQLNAFWNGIQNLFGLNHITDIPTIDTSNSWWTNIINNKVNPTGILTQQTYSNGLNSQLSQLGDIFNQNVVVPINTAMQNVYNWFNVSQPKITNSSAWLTRFIEDETIIWDVFGNVYQLGSSSDTPTTLGTNGKRTRWSAVNDLTQLLGLSKGTATPAATVAVNVGSSIQANATNHQALADAVNTGVVPSAPANATAPVVNGAVAQLTQAVSGLQSQVVNLQNNVNGPTTILRDSGQDSPGTTTLGPNWTISGVNVVNRDANYGFIWGNRSSLNTSRLEIGIYKTPLTTNDQVSTIVFNALMDYWPADFYGGTYYQDGAPANWIILRADTPTNPQNYVFARIRYNDVQFGYCKAGAITMIGSPTTFKATTSSSYSFKVGDASSDYNWTLVSGGKTILSWTDSSHVTNFAVNNLYTGQAWQSDNDPGRSNESAPGATSWSAYDAVASAGTPGGYGHINRFSTSTATINAPGSVPSGFYDNTVALGQGLTLPTSGSAGFVVTQAGLYTFSWGLRQSSTSSSFVAMPGILVDDTLTEVGSEVIYISNGGTLLSGIQMGMASAGLVLNAGQKVSPAIFGQSGPGEIGPVTGSTGWCGDSSGARSFCKIAKMA